MAKLKLSKKKEPWSCCLPRRTDTCTNVHSVDCGSDSSFPRYLCARTDLGFWFPSSLASNSFTVHRYCVNPRSQCGSGRSGFHCGVSTLGNWVSNSKPGEWNEFRRGAMVGGYCCFSIHEHGMVWSGDVGGDCWRCYIRPMLVWRGQAMVGSKCDDSDANADSQNMLKPLFFWVPCWSLSGSHSADHNHDYFFFLVQAWDDVGSTRSTRTRCSFCWCTLNHWQSMSRCNIDRGTTLRLFRNEVLVFHSWKSTLG